MMEVVAMNVVKLDNNVTMYSGPEATALKTVKARIIVVGVGEGRRSLSRHDTEQVKSVCMVDSRFSN